MERGGSQQIQGGNQHKRVREAGGLNPLSPPPPSVVPDAGGAVSTCSRSTEKAINAMLSHKPRFHSQITKDLESFLHDWSPSSNNPQLH